MNNKELEDTLTDLLSPSTASDSLPPDATPEMNLEVTQNKLQFSALTNVQLHLQLEEAREELKKADRLRLEGCRLIEEVQKKADHLGELLAKKEKECRNLEHKLKNCKCENTDKHWIHKEFTDFVAANPTLKREPSLDHEKVY